LENPATGFALNTFALQNTRRAFGDPLFDLGEELFTGELAGGVRIGVVFLGHGHDEFEMDVQAELEHGLGGINDGGGQPAGAAA
jgi:hypothetical protein